MKNFKRETSLRPSFFGGDPSVSHFSVGVVYKTKDEANIDVGGERRKLQRRTLKTEFGFTEKYFQYRNTDAKGKQRAHEAALAFAADLTARSGIELEVSEGFFL